MTNLRIIIALLIIVCSHQLFAGAPEWNIIPSSYQYTMNATVLLNIDESIRIENTNVIGAFVGNEVRGVILPNQVDTTWMFFLTIYSNISSGEAIMFKAYLAQEDTVIPLTDTVLFVSDEILGDPETPVEFHGSIIPPPSLRTTTMFLNGDWNMISVPLLAEDNSKENLFPDAVSRAFSYYNGYTIKDSLQKGIGYWIKLPHDTSHTTITGYTLGKDTIQVYAGWNMIGSGSKPFPVSSIVKKGTTVVSSYFGYSSGYLSATTLEPGKAYWVKVSQDGSLILPATTAGKADEDIQITRERE